MHLLLTDCRMTLFLTAPKSTHSYIMGADCQNDTCDKCDTLLALSVWFYVLGYGLLDGRHKRE